MKLKSTVKKFGSSKRTSVVPRAPFGKRLYAIGDVHGCLKQLEVLMQKIKRDVLSAGNTDVFYVFLGDLIDRGPASAGVVKFVKEFSEKKPNCYTLMGNHEDIFIKAYHGDMEAMRSWMRHGGYQTLESYGLDPILLNHGSLDQILIKMKKNIPKSHIHFLSNCLDSVEFGDFFLVHAGVAPDIPLANQSRSAFLWMREPFLSHPRPLEKVIVHGHTVEPRVTRYMHRINVDTGAYSGGPLSAVRLEADIIEIIEAFPHENPNHIEFAEY